MITILAFIIVFIVAVSHGTPLGIAIPGVIIACAFRLAMVAAMHGKRP